MKQDKSEQFKVLSFDLGGDYAHYRKPYATISPLTYGVPTPTALAGLFAALLGKERDSYYEDFNQNNSKFGVKIKNGIKKLKVALNLVDTKSNKEIIDLDQAMKNSTKDLTRTQVPFEFVKEPRYRIYFQSQNEDLFSQIKQKIKSGKSVYTPYLGISECLAKLGNAQIEEAYRLSPEEVFEIDSIVDRGKVSISSVDEERIYMRERLSRGMNASREVKSYVDIVYDKKGASLMGRGEIYQIGDQKVVMF